MEHNFLSYHSAPHDHGPVLPVKCPVCENKTYWHLYRYRTWILLFHVLPLPVRNDYYLRCIECEHDIRLSKTEANSAIALIRHTNPDNDTHPRPDFEKSSARLIRRIKASEGNHINTDPDANWNDINDQLLEAIKLSLYQPQTAIDRLNDLLLEKVNINAKNSVGDTLLSIARFHLAPREILDIIEKESSKDKQAQQVAIEQQRRWLTTNHNGRINTDHGTQWEKINDQFSEAIMLGNYKPQEAMDKINKLLINGLNINARNSDGQTLLSIARYNVVPSAIQNLIKSAGGE